MKAKRSCTNRACAMHGMEVETELEDCVSCGRRLRLPDAVENIIDAFDKLTKDRRD